MHKILFRKIATRVAVAKTQKRATREAHPHENHKHTPNVLLSPACAAACSDVPARRRRFPPTHPLLLAHAVSHFASPCPALCVPPMEENTLMAEPQAVPASGEAAPLPSLEPALDAALRERCAAAGFPDFFISHGAASYGAEKGSLRRQALIPACLHTQRPGRVGSHAAAARVAIEYHRSILTGTRRLTASMAATAACSLAAAAAAVGRGGAPLTSSEAPAAPTAARQRQRAAARGSGTWRPSSAPQVAGRRALVHGRSCASLTARGQRRAGPVPSGMSVRYLATSVLRVSRRCQSRAEQAVAEAEDAARDGPWK